jgi:hypothetical protein
MKVMNKLNKHLLVATITLGVITAGAREKFGNVYRTNSAQKVFAGCSPAQASAELAVNNVRTIIFSGSDMWWDLFGGGNAWYVVPKVADRTKGASSNFAGNVWFGGLDAANQLKIAAQTYRQGGVDFWTGPLSTIDASTTADVCSEYDKIFKLTRTEVDNFVLGGGPITTNIQNWPGNGNIALNHDPNLAPYVDFDGSGDYNPLGGDYPYYDVYNTGLKDNLNTCKARVFGDETLWWVYNDNGSNHVATGGKAIGMEIRAQAFAFKTTDEINNMTFYNYQLINRSSFALYNTYMTVWTDADLGYYGDDYIGCDVKRGLGYIYNSKPDDISIAGTPGYGANIPALGCDFFQGPINTTNGIDDNGNGVIDETGEQMGMTKFLYFNNSFAGVPLQTTDPDNATQYYQYMTGYWRDGTPFTCNTAGTGNGYGEAIPTSFVYPADTYTNGPCGAASWSENGVAGDRRFMQSSGPFELQPGAVNFITVGLPWARTTSTDPKASIPLLKIADDKAQALFDNCFRVLSGPEAPDMTIQEMNNELIIYFSNKPSSNNYLNQYKELDISIIPDPAHYPGTVDNYYRFEGFKVFQLKNSSVTQEELGDQSKAKLVFNCDIANGVKRLINYEYDATTGGDVPKVKVELNDDVDKGIKSTFHFTKDQFSTATDQKVINNKEYYFYCVAYGYNQYGEYKEDQPFTSVTTFTSATGPTTYYTAPCSEGQKRPYLEGRKSKKAFGIPHNTDNEKDGTVANSMYGYGPKVTRIEGQGNGGNFLDLTSESVNNILASSTGRKDVITYENGSGPINIKVVDPLNVPNSTFSFKFVNRNWFNNLDTVNSDPCRSSTYHKQFPYNKLSTKNTQYGNILSDSTTWILKDLGTNKEYSSCKSIRIGEEFYFSDLGLSINIGQSRDVAEKGNPAVSTTDNIVQPGDVMDRSGISFADPASAWLTGVVDQDGTTPYNWIRAGNFEDPNSGIDNDAKVSGDFADPSGIFENVIGGTWAPYALVASTKTGSIEAAPGFSGSSSATGIVPSSYDMRALASVNIVLTKDKNNWTRCLVLEENDEVSANPSGAKKLETRRSKSVDKQGVPLGAAGCVTAEASVDSIPGSPFQYGLSWFPGYAINMETGERLNIAFGEDSYQDPSNPVATNYGNDMMWNPTTLRNTNRAYPYAFGGRHYIYVFGNNRSTSTYTTATGTSAIMNGRHIGVGNYSAFAEFAYNYKKCFTIAGSQGVNLMNNIWSEAMWVSLPVLVDARYGFKDPANMPCDATVKLRVKKPFKYGMSGGYYVTNVGQRKALTAAEVVPTDITSTNYSRLTTDTVSGSVNNNFGYYTFNTSDIYTQTQNAEKLKSALDLINIVPNPYYAHSAYEKSRIDNIVRITNLPNKCKIKIFTLNGTLIRTFDRDVSGQEDVNVEKTDYVSTKRLPFQDWDLKNQSGITVASGLYIVHVDVPGVGEKILKWFGVMRPMDLQSY